VLVLVRHGEATANASGLLLGRTDVPLTEDGWAQARALGPHVGTVSRLVSSPLRRALDTAGALELGIPVEIDERWIEVDYGEHEGRALGDVPADVWRRWRGEPDFRPAGGETLAEVGARVRRACEVLFATRGDGARSDRGDVVVVSHVSPIKAAVAWALGAEAGLDWRLQLSTGSITRIGWGADGPVLHSFNEIPTVPPPGTPRP
jgi:probable phosphoglycerate mutase